MFLALIIACETAEVTSCEPYINAYRLFQSYEECFAEGMGVAQLFIVEGGYERATPFCMLTHLGEPV